MKKNYIFFQWGVIEGKRDYSYVIMLDAIKQGNLKIYTGPGFLKRGRGAEIHYRICRARSYLSRLFYPLYLPKSGIERGESILLFNEAHPCLKNLGFITWVRKQYNAKTVLVLRNRIRNKKIPAVHGISLEILKQTFDLIATDEKVDAELFGLVFAPDPFSPLTNRKAKIKYDICFTGGDKGRGEMISAIADQAEAVHAKYDFKIVDNFTKKVNLKYVSYQPYTEVIKQDMQSNCILEVLQPGQDSYTLRLQEAVCLNKKLLTNNPKVKEEKYYDPRYVQIFENIEDINWDFVKERIDVDYHYEGEYSPIVFLNHINKELERREQSE